MRRHPTLYPLSYHVDCTFRIHTLDLSGLDLAEVSDRLVKLASRAKYLSDVKQTETFLVLPLHLRDRLNSNLSLDLVRTLAPHIGLEADLPIDGDWIAEAVAEYGIVQLPFELLRRITYFGLGIYR